MRILGTLSFKGRRSRNRVIIGEPIVGSLIGGVLFFGSGWVGLDCNMGPCGVSLAEQVWCFAGTLLVAFL